MEDTEIKQQTVSILNFIDFLGKGLQDPFSVVLSQTREEQEEERIDISINKMLEEYVWSKD